MLDESHNSDNESDSNTSFNFNKKLSLFNEDKNNEVSNQVINSKIILIILFIERKRKQFDYQFSKDGEKQFSIFRK